MGGILLLMINIATSKNIGFYFIDVSNVFHSNVIHDPAKRHYLYLSSLYMQWFCLHFPHHPLSKSKDPHPKIVLQMIQGIQGTKDTGHEWYTLLALILV